MKVVWTEEALENRDSIILFIAKDNPDAAIKLDDLFTDAGESLMNFPMRGRRGRDEKSRELVVHKHYILVYGIDVDKGFVYIKAVLHTSQEPNKRFLTDIE